MHSNLLQRAFSLIELLVAITVLALILLVAMPAAASWLDGTRIRNIAESMQSGIQIARAEAVRRNRPVSFWLVATADPALLTDDCTLSSTSGSWVVSLNSPESHCGASPSVVSAPMLVAGKPAGEGAARVDISAFHNAVAKNEPAHSITFDGFGRVVNMDDAIRLIDVTAVSSDVKLRLAISTTGSVRMCDPRVTNPHDAHSC